MLAVAGETTRGLNLPNTLAQALAFGACFGGSLLLAQKISGPLNKALAESGRRDCCLVAGIAVHGTAGLGGLYLGRFVTELMPPIELGHSHAA